MDVHFKLLGLAQGETGPDILGDTVPEPYQNFSSLYYSGIINNYVGV